MLRPAFLKLADRGRLYALSYAPRNPAELSVLIYAPGMGENADIFSGRACAMYGKAENFSCEPFMGFGPDRIFAATGQYGDYLRLTCKLKRHELADIRSALSLLLEILAGCLRYEKRIQLDPARKQLLILETGSEHPGLEGEFSPAMVDWIQSKKASQLTGIQRAMFDVRNVFAEQEVKIIPNSPNPLSPIEIWKKPGGWLSLDCGGASSMVDDQFREQGKGYTLTCHNVDAAFQQLSIVAGYAVLHDLACADLDPPPS